jgi:hypothetical protein
VKQLSKIINKISKMNSTELNHFARTYPNLFKGHTTYTTKEEKLRLLTNRLTRRNVLQGGKGDKLIFDEAILREVDMGIVIEYEHTRDFWTSLDIVFDHLEEIPDYYTRLKKMEEQGERYWKTQDRQLIIDIVNKV